VRKIFHKCWFANTPAVEDGLMALGFYHEKRHEDRNVGLGPEHDWSSHAADAFGLMAICYEEPGSRNVVDFYTSSGAGAGWMAS
jgi:phage terminase large subunit